MTSTDDMERNSQPTTPPRRRLGASLTLPNLLLLLFAVIAAATGQLMLKHGMTGVAEDGQP